MFFSFFYFSCFCLLTFFAVSYKVFSSQAAIAQLVEHVICNLGVQGSSPCGGFNKFHGEFPEWSKGTDCKSAASCFVGSNPSLPISESPCIVQGLFFALLPFYPGWD